MLTLMMYAILNASWIAVNPMSLDQTRQLFLDDTLIASKENVTRTIHQVHKHPDNPLIWPTEAWEGDKALIHGSVIRDGDLYRMWYLSTPGVSYAESQDGIHWTKPRLDLFEVDGEKTNIILQRLPEGGMASRKPGSNALEEMPYSYEILGLRKDMNEADPNRRYKMAFISIQQNYKGPHEDPYHRKNRRGIGIAVSPDGFHWELVGPWTTEAICDGPGHILYEPLTQKYILYGRTKYTAPDVAERNEQDPWNKRHYFGRSVVRVESTDMIHWDKTERTSAPLVLAPDIKDPMGDEIYSMNVFPYESVYIGLVQMYHNRPDVGTLDVQLAVSHDGWHFERVGDRSTFIPLGQVGDWDRFNVSLANNPPLIVGDELRFYFSGRTYRHGGYEGDDKGIPGGGIGMGTILRDRFVSLGASFKGGVIVTKPLQLKGTTLYLNAKSDYGEIVVEVIDAKGHTLARSKPVKGDKLDMPVEWEEGNLTNVTGPVTFKITLRNALLFSIWCT